MPEIYLIGERIKGMERCHFISDTHIFADISYTGKNVMVVAGHEMQSKIYPYFTGATILSLCPDERDALRICKEQHQDIIIADINFLRNPAGFLDRVKKYDMCETL